MERVCRVFCRLRCDVRREGGGEWRGGRRGEESKEKIISGTRGIVRSRGIQRGVNFSRTAYKFRHEEDGNKGSGGLWGSRQETWKWRRVWYLLMNTYLHYDACLEP